MSEPAAALRFDPCELVQLRGGGYENQTGIVLSVERDFYKPNAFPRHMGDDDRLEVLWAVKDGPYISFEPALCLERLPAEDE